MNKLNELCDMIDALDLPESKKYNMRLLASQVDTNGFSRGFKAGIKEGRELEAMEYLPHNQPEFRSKILTERWESIRPNIVLEDHINETIG